MSCFNCYSSHKLNGDLVDKVLEQGQKLRDSIVQTILNNDPLYNQQVKRSVKLDDLTEENNEKIRAFLRGDALSREDEISTLETLRSLSARDLCRATDRTYRSEEPCDCFTCCEYKNRDLNCDLKRNIHPPLEITQKLQEKYKNTTLPYLKYVDSLKVTIGSVILNQAGNKKVFNSLLKDKVAGVGQSYFLEYQIPEVLTKNQTKGKSKVDSGLDSTNTVRICSRGAHQQALSFKQTSIHDISLFNKDLDEISLKFRLSFRNFKQKHPILLGCATFDFDSFTVAKNFTCNQELCLKLNDNSPITVGVLRVSLQLGCGRLYFGKEFIEAVSNNKENAVALDSDDLSSVVSFSERSQFLIVEPPIRKKEPPLQQKPRSFNKTEKIITKSSTSLVKESHSEIVLFGFVYISETQYSREVLNSYLNCQLFGHDDSVRSKLVAFDSNPIYNFCQQFPLVYDGNFLLKLRENFMVIEFFEKGDVREFLIGISKISLHQFYLAYRNPLIVKYLSEKKLPVIGTDGWEPIINPVDEEIVGQTQILVALGTKEQIDTLENERGFKKDIVKAKSTPRLTRKSGNHKNKTVDIGTQFETKMESKESQNIEELLNQIVAQKPRNVHVENSTNTEPVDTNTKLRSTSDLLNSLQKALTDPPPTNEKNYFKAHVAINNGLHLPSRKKCKSKKSKGKIGKHEDILPSTYVTFEVYKGDLKITPIIPKSTSPKWEYHCDVNLPIEYLENNQKFLVFKVWRKSINTTMTPNMQTDVIIGFATVDLTVLLAGLPSVQGWYNVNDLSNKCNGQINIHVTPLENLTKYQAQMSPCCLSEPLTLPQTSQQSDEPNELLGRALKRKFTELDEITQRLRLRLSKVTNDESDTSNDEIADEFERDINTICVEDDFDMIDFEKEGLSLNINDTKEVGLLQLDNHLNEGKQKIDSLLQKLSLISTMDHSSRYVSGCSDRSIDTETILNDLDSHSRPNIHSNSDSFTRDMTQKFSSSLTNDSCIYSENRSGPEGEQKMPNK